MQAVEERKYVWICLYHANAPFKIFVIHIHGWLHVGVWETEHNSKYTWLINPENEWITLRELKTVQSVKTGG